MKWGLPVKQKISTKYGPLTISFHALRRFYNRSVKIEKDWIDKDIDFIYQKFKDEITKTKEKERRNSVLQMLRHGYQKAKYIVSEQWVFVISEDNTIQTCYLHETTKGNFRDYER